MEAAIGYLSAIAEHCTEVKKKFYMKFSENYSYFMYEKLVTLREKL
jgi:hypothetical protein